MRCRDLALALVWRFAAAFTTVPPPSNETHVYDEVSRRLLPRGRVECPVGWGQFNDDNIRLHIKKQWTRVCFYCWHMTTESSAGMEKLVVGSPWDEQQFYREFYIYGCGGMFGTPKFIEDNPSRARRVPRRRTDFKNRTLFSFFLGAAAARRMSTRTTRAIPLPARSRWPSPAATRGAAATARAAPSGGAPRSRRSPPPPPSPSISSAIEGAWRSLLYRPVLIVGSPITPLAGSGSSCRSPQCALVEPE